jgi:DNA-binding CsgD family transcriptional regulator
MPANELCLDYKDLVAGQVVIVIQGIPTAGHNSYTPGALELAKPGPVGPENTRNNGGPSSPLFEEVEAISAATRYTPVLFTPLLLAAWRGHETLAAELIAAMSEEARAEDAGRTTARTEYAKALLYNGLGRYERAIDAARRAHAQDELGLSGWALLELVEAGARTEARADATDAVRHLEERARADATDWAHGVWARSAALLSDGNAAEALYREAIERFERGQVAVHLARAQLVYGEWLRRKNRRVDAREQLRAAHHTFTALTAEGFAERARRELLATGETARSRTDDTRDTLTPQEAEIAKLAGDGLSNPEIATQLFLSPRTVQYHLRKVFLKLDITSRNQLSRVPAERLSAA